MWGGKPLPPGPIQPQLLDLASAVFTLRPGPFPFNGLLHLLLIEIECPCKADNSYHMISQKKACCSLLENMGNSQKVQSRGRNTRMPFYRELRWLRDGKCQHSVRTLRAWPPAGWRH